MNAAGLLREAGERDANAIVALWTEAYFTEGGGGRTTPYSTADFVEAAQNACLFAVERERTVVGVAALLAPGAPGCAGAEAGEAELSRLVVAASARRVGVGRMLVTHCEGLAKASGWSAIALWSRRYQEAAHRLYESLGYRRVPERDCDDPEGRRLIFVLDL